MTRNELEEYRKLEYKALEFATNKNNDPMTLEIKFPKKHLLKVLKFLQHLNE